MGDTKAFDYFRDNYLTDLIPESGNAGTFYLHPNKKEPRHLVNSGVTEFIRHFI